MEDNEDEIIMRCPNDNFKQFYPSFNDIPITTVTGHGKMNGMVHCANIFNLIPVHKVQMIGKDLPKVGIKGAIISVRQTDRQVRGIDRGGSFKNCVMIDMGFDLTRNLSCKLSKSTIHIAGAKSEEMLREGTKVLVSIINSIQDELSFIQDHLNEAKLVVEHIENVSKGDITISPEGYLVHHLKPPSLLQTYCDDPEEWSDVHKKIYYFLVLHIDEFLYHEDLVSDINSIISLSNIIDKQLSIIDTKIVMVNVNYDLKFTIDLFELNDRINNINGFFCRFENCVDHSATVELRYTPDFDETVTKKPEVKKITFLVYSCGVVTQSGPSKAKNEEAYNLFIETIHLIKPCIMSQKLRKIKISKKPSAETVDMREMYKVLIEESDRLKGE
jgi:hypothetical protein